jgi:hypothetical protein
MAAHLISHPSADVLQAFALGKLNDTSASVVMNHLDRCPDCCQQVAALSVDDFLDRLRQAHDRSSTPAPAKSLAEAANALKPPASQAPIPNLPLQLAANDQYEILRELGRGGMGVVYLAKNKLMDRLEVLKVINKALLDRPGAVERFLREIRSAAKLSHANVVTAYSAVQQGELLAFAMEYIEGQDLASLVKSRGPVPIVHACYYIQQAALGLQHAYEKGMVHRDIKPQNLILAREGKKHIVKVLDFGLAKATPEKQEDTGLTGEGAMLGTPDYISPEQSLDAAKADIRADTYSLGCTLYFLLAGRPPFSASSLGAILMAHQTEEAKPLNIVRPEVPEELAAVVRKMMAKSPAKRYQTPLEVVQALGLFVKQASGAAPASRVPPSPELSVGAVEANPAVKKLPRVNPPSVPAAPAAKKQPEPVNVWESLAEGGIAPAEPRRRERFCDLTAGSLLTRSISFLGPRKSRTIRKPRAATVGERASRNKWLTGSSLFVVLLLAWFAMWASGMLLVKSKYGTIVLENLPADAEVRVDDETITLKAGDGGTLTITAEKKHRLQVKKEGFKFYVREVEIEAGERRLIRVSLQPETNFSQAVAVRKGMYWEGIKTWTNQTKEQTWLPGMKQVISLEITEVNGKQFKGIMRFSSEQLPIKGTINGATIEWTGDGAPSEKHTAQIEGKEMKGDCENGTLILNLKELPTRWRASIVRGFWKIDNGDIIQTSLEYGPTLLFGDPDLSDYDFSFRAKAEQGLYSFRAYFHYSAPGEFYQYTIGNYGNIAHDLSFEHEGKWGRNPGMYVEGRIDANRWYDMRVEVRGKDYRCFLDGRELFSCRDERFTRGRIGISSLNSVVRFRDIRVTTPEGRLLWRGLPDLPN